MGRACSGALFLLFFVASPHNHAGAGRRPLLGVENLLVVVVVVSINTCQKQPVPVNHLNITFCSTPFFFLLPIRTSFALQRNGVAELTGRTNDPRGDLLLRQTDATSVNKSQTAALLDVPAPGPCGISYFIRGALPHLTAAPCVWLPFPFWLFNLTFVGFSGCLGVASLSRPPSRLQPHCTTPLAAHSVWPTLPRKKQR